MHAAYITLEIHILWGYDEQSLKLKLSSTHSKNMVKIDPTNKRPWRAIRKVSAQNID